MLSVLLATQPGCATHATPISFAIKGSVRYRILYDRKLFLVDSRQVQLVSRPKFFYIILKYVKGKMASKDEYTMAGRCEKGEI